MKQKISVLVVMVVVGLWSTLAQADQTAECYSAAFPENIGSQMNVTFNDQGAVKHVEIVVSNVKTSSFVKGVYGYTKTVKGKFSKIEELLTWYAGSSFRTNEMHDQMMPKEVIFYDGHESFSNELKVYVQLVTHSGSLFKTYFCK